jgi:hypothetical protein
MPKRIQVSKTKGARLENKPSAQNNNAFAMEMGKTSYACKGGSGFPSTNTQNLFLWLWFFA